MNFNQLFLQQRKKKLERKEKIELHAISLEKYMKTRTRTRGASALKEKEEKKERKSNYTQLDIIMYNKKCI